MGKRDLILLAAVIALAAVMAWGIFAGEAAQTAGWGLCFREEGAPPVGNLDRKTLAGHNAAYMGSPEEKVLYLTFDAGYEAGYTEKILDTLEKHQVKAAFFLVGDYVNRNADLTRQIVARGHIVGNHTMHHPDMTGLSREEFQKELGALEDAYREVTGGELPRFYRPPQGVYNEETLEYARELGYKTIFWSLAYADWDRNNQPTREQALGKLLPRTHPGAIILLHSTSATNGEILDELITKWKEMGYRFGTLEELEIQNKSPTGGI